MSNRILIAGASVALVVFVVLLWQTRQPAVTGPTGPAETTTTAGTDSSPHSSGKTPAAPKPYLSGWADPTAALVFSGEMHGYIEPCGCTSGQLGGLARRGDLLQKLRAKKWNVTAFDVGGLMNSERARRKQSEYKLPSAVDSFKQLGYTAIAIGSEEIQVNTDILVSRADDPFVSANVSLLEADPANVAEVVAMDAGRKSWNQVQVGPIKVAVTGILGTKYQTEILGARHANGKVSAVDPAAALKEVLPLMEAAKPDLMVLLSHATVEESKALAKQFPQFQIVATAGGPEDPGFSSQHVGETLLVMAGGKGKRVAVVGYYPKEKPSLKFELVDLDEGRFDNLPAMDDQMRAYQETLERENIARHEPPRPHPGNSVASGEDLKYVGAAKCGECHTKSYGKWKNTKHAHAFDALINGRKGQKTVISRIHDPECLACHVTGWDPKHMVPYTSGYLFEELLTDRKGKQVKPDLKGQQCENCHGPGSAHVQEEVAYKKSGKTTAETTKWRKFHKLDLKVVETQLCIRCHDGENDPNFGKKPFAEYWDQIKHPGKD